jgi:hypothetical protein
MTTEPTTITIEPINTDDVGTRLAIVERDASLPEDSAVALRGQFAGFFTDIVEWRDKAALVTKPEDKTHQKIAREVRLGLRGVRCGVENTRKALKAESLARGKAIDGFANVLKYLCEPIEEKLLAVEQFAERQEAARIAELVEARSAILVTLEADPTAYNLGVMDEATWVLVLAGAKKSYDDRIEAVRVAEADRVAREQADRIAREKAEVENARLRKEAKAREARIEAERKAVEAERARVEAERAKERAEAEKARKAAEAAREAIEAKAKAQREAAEEIARREKIKADAALAREREAREKAERDAAEAKRKEQARIDAEKAAEAKRKAEEAEAARKAAAAPDREKLCEYGYAILNMEYPKMTTKEGMDLLEIIIEKRGAFVKWIAKQAEAL